MDVSSQSFLQPRLTNPLTGTPFTDREIYDPDPVSPERIAANRANAQQSTGPRTPEGKARSSRNALKRGLFSKQLIVPALGEVPEEFDALHADMRARYRPQGREEALLVDKMATAYWRLARAGNTVHAEFQRYLEADPGERMRALHWAESARPVETSLERGIARDGARLDYLQTRRFGGKKPAFHLNDAGAVPAANYTPPCGVAEAPPRPAPAPAPAPARPAEDPMAWAERKLFFTEEQCPEEFFLKHLDEQGRPRLKVWPDDQPFPVKFRSGTPLPGQPEPNWPPHSPQFKLRAAERAERERLRQAQQPQPGPSPQAVTGMDGEDARESLQSASSPSGSTDAEEKRAAEPAPEPAPQAAETPASGTTAPGTEAETPSKPAPGKPRLWPPEGPRTVWEQDGIVMTLRDPWDDEPW